MPATPRVRLTPRRAYLVMFEFLARHYDRGSDEISGELLDRLYLLNDGTTVDPAIWDAWEAAVAAVLAAERLPMGYRGANWGLNREDVSDLD